MRYIGALGILSLMLAATSTASAISATDGDVIESGSWIQGGWYENGYWADGTKPFDHMQITMLTPGVAWEMPVYSGFSAAGWTCSLTADPATVCADGPDTTYVAWTYKFPGLSSTPITVLVSVGLNGVERPGTQTLYYLQPGKGQYDAGGGWRCDYFTPSEAIDAPVPEPVTMCGLLLGVAGLVRYTRKRAA